MSFISYSNKMQLEHTDLKCFGLQRHSCLKGFPGEPTTNHITGHYQPLSAAPISVGSSVGLWTGVRNLDSVPGHVGNSTKHLLSINWG